LNKLFTFYQRARMSIYWTLVQWPFGLQRCSKTNVFKSAVGKRLSQA